MAKKTTSKTTGKEVKITVCDLEGAKSGSLGVPEEFLKIKITPSLIAQAVRVYLSNQRKAYAKVKTRHEVSGSRRKIWSQKGTGRARHGDRYAPIFVGGGVTHGPTGAENYKLSLSKRMKRKAILMALVDKIKNGAMVSVKSLEKIEPKTKKAMLLVEKIKAGLAADRADSKFKKALLLLKEKQTAPILAFRNLKDLSIRMAGHVNVYEILDHDFLIIDPEAMKIWQNWLLKTKIKSKSKSKLKDEVKKTIKEGKNES